VRWRIFWLLFAFAMVAYLQRTSVPVAAQRIMSDLGVSQVEIGWLDAAFTAAYALAQLPGGVLGLKLGARRTLTLVGLLGIVATLGTPLAPLLGTGTALFAALLGVQVLLGISQGPVFPVLTATLQRWFPSRQWAMANGVTTAGMNLGGAVTPVVIVGLTAAFGWKGALLSTIVPAVLLTAAWAWYARDRPAEHPDVRPEELAELDADASEPDPPVTAKRLLSVLGDRNVLLLAFSYFCMNYTYYLLSFWSFLYLVQERHFDGLESGLAGALPWIGAGIGAAAGGYLSDALALRLGVRWGYRLVPLAALPLAGVLLFATVHVSTPYAAVAALTLAFCAIELSEGAYWAAAMTVARTDTAAAGGVLNTGGNLGGIVTHPLVGALSAMAAWNGAFLTGTAFALVAAVCWLFVDAQRPIRLHPQG
jgi:sugar phosphate permease